MVVIELFRSFATRRECLVGFVLYFRFPADKPGFLANRHSCQSWDVPFAYIQPAAQCPVLFPLSWLFFFSSFLLVSRPSSRSLATGKDTAHTGCAFIHTHTFVVTYVWTEVRTCKAKRDGVPQGEIVTWLVSTAKCSQGIAFKLHVYMTFPSGLSCFLASILHSFMATTVSLSLFPSKRQKELVSLGDTTQYLHELVIGRLFFISFSLLHQHRRGRRRCGCRRVMQLFLCLYGIMLIHSFIHPSPTFLINASII